MKRLIYLCILLMCSISISAQSADKLYDEGKKLYDQEQYKEAVPKLQAAADKGHKKAQYRLGRCYDKGYGVKENDQKAFELYQKSAKQDYAKAMFQLGKCYMKGKGTAKDSAKAKAWMLKAMKNDKAKEKLKEDVAEGDKTAIALQKLIGK